MHPIPVVVALFAHHVITILVNYSQLLAGVAFGLVEDDLMMQQVQSSTNFTRFTSLEAAPFALLDTR